MDVTINLENNDYIEETELFKKDCKTPKPPVKPSKKISTNCRLLHTLQDYNSLTLFNQDAYRKYREFKEKSLSVNLKDMNVGDNIAKTT